MPRTVDEAALTTKSARAKLTPREKPYWRSLGTEVHLGYRRGLKKGKWLVRWYSGGRYIQKPIGTADDHLDADGINVLNFAQASTRARELVTAAFAKSAAEAAGPLPKVRDAVGRYVTVRNTREDRHAGTEGDTGKKRDAKSRLTKHVLDHPIAAKGLHELMEADLSGWRSSLPRDLAHTTIDRIVNDFKAALNAEASRERARLPATLPATIKAGLKAETVQGTVSRQQVLPDADIRRLVAAGWTVDERDGWDGDLGRINLTLAATGARFSQLARMHVSDVQVTECRLMVPTSRKGKGKKQIAKTAVRVGQDVIDALKPAIAGRKGTEPLFIRWRHIQTSPTVWTRDHRGAWKTASEFTQPWKAIIEQAEMPADTIPYCYRHSSIVRGLRAALPVKLVASLHDTSAAMIEKHYAAFIVDAMDELAARAVVPLSTAPATVTPITRKEAS
ncbi:MAG TPA: tyrosine-type recombinase/integrase [Beijerinckiaceae bacterium]|nr:tyrosine-type recombinase/integrase [Beijerinckiaceae bacterium]